MTWLPLLLADPSPCQRLLTQRDLLHRPDDDPEVRELAALCETDPLVSELLALQGADGSWEKVHLSSHVNRFQATSLALARLGYLGLGRVREESREGHKEEGRARRLASTGVGSGPSSAGLTSTGWLAPAGVGPGEAHPAVERGVEYLFSMQQEDGSWPLGEVEEGEVEPVRGREGYSMVPLQTALPLRGLAMCGYATDPRAERAYDWLLARRLADGAWPTGIASGNYGYVAGYRRLTHSRWGCRSNTTGALICLAHHPRRRSGEEARRALDLLLGRETREQYALGFEVARLMGGEPARGFLTFYARFDLALILDLCWRVGATLEDERVAEAVEFVRGLQGPYGLWEYASRPQLSRWVTLDLLRSLSRLDLAGEWLSVEPRTPFQAYPRKLKRF